MKSRLFFILIIICTISVSGQTSAIVVWEDRYTEGSVVEFYSIKNTTDGGAIVAGDQDNNGIVQKYNSLYSIEWSRIYDGEGSGPNLIRSILECSDGGYVFAGTVFNGNGGQNLWLCKLNDSGDIIWEYFGFQEGEQYGRDVIETEEGNYLIIGHGMTPATNSYDYLAALIDSSGNELWSRSYGTTNIEKAWAVTETIDNGFAIAGYAHVSGGDPSFYLLKIDQNGDEVWNGTYDNGWWERPYALCNDPNGGFVLAGKVGTTPGNLMCVRFDQDGIVTWSRSYPSELDNHARAITMTQDRGFLIAGHYGGSGYPYDQSLTKIDSVGNIISQQIFESDFDDYGWALEYINDNNYLIAGSSDSNGYVTLINPVVPSGNVVINEIMINPNRVNDIEGEWFELVNTSQRIVNLQEWQVISNAENYTIDTELLLHPHNYVVFASNSDSTTNGGLSVLLEYSGISLNNVEDEILLLDSISTIIDSVSWSSVNGFPLESGVSTALIDPGMDNAISENWEFSQVSFGLGDFGTPNFQNSYATIEVLLPIDEFPLTMVGASNTVSFTMVNRGNDTLRLYDISVSNPEFELGLFDSLVSPFSEINVELQFTPIELGERFSTIIMSNNSYGNELFQIQVSGTSISANPDISCDPDVLYFLTNSAVDTLMLEVIISNEGTLDLVINDIEVSSNPTDYDFSIYSGVVPSGGEAILELSYHGPKSPIPDPNTLVIYSNDPDEASYSIQILFIHTDDVQADIYPTAYTLQQNFPNPFNPTTTIQYGIPENGMAFLAIYDIRGYEIIRIDNGLRQPGWYHHTWNGQNDRGLPVSTGIYLARLQAGPYSKTIKMLYLK
jgi:hypothetical protein